MQVKREAPVNIQSTSGTCPECGLIHPPCPRGECPIKKAEEARKSTHFDTIDKVMDVFRADEGDLDMLADMIQKTIKVWKLKYKNK